MSKRRFTEIGWRTDPSFRALCRALAACNTEKTVADLLRDVGTLSELKAWSERFEIARLLKAGKPYRAICSITGASTTTVTRVASFLQSGEGGYRAAFAGHHHHASFPRGEKMVSKA